MQFTLFRNLPFTVSVELSTMLSIWYMRNTAAFIQRDSIRPVKNMFILKTFLCLSIAFKVCAGSR